MPEGETKYIDQVPDISADATKSGYAKEDPIGFQADRSDCSINVVNKLHQLARKVLGGGKLREADARESNSLNERDVLATLSVSERERITAQLLQTITEFKQCRALDTGRRKELVEELSSLQEPAFSVFTSLDKRIFEPRQDWSRFHLKNLRKFADDPKVRKHSVNCLLTPRPKDLLFPSSVNSYIKPLRSGSDVVGYDFFGHSVDFRIKPIITLIYTNPIIYDVDVKKLEDRIIVSFIVADENIGCHFNSGYPITLKILEPEKKHAYVIDRGGGLFGLDYIKLYSSDEARIYDEQHNPTTAGSVTDEDVRQQDNASYCNEDLVDE